MKLRADLKLVKQRDIVGQEEESISNCVGCVFYATRENVNSLCNRINRDKLSCGANRIWVFDEEQWNSYKEIV